MKPTVDKSIVIDTLRVTESDYNGLNVAIVGGTGGLGRALSRFLAERGANVMVVGQTFRDAGVKNISFLKADLSLMSEAKRVAKELPAENLDLLLLTTGIFAAPKRQASAEGLELDMAISYLSRLVIMRGVADRLGKNRAGKPKPRIFIWGFPGVNQKGSTSDMNSEKSYNQMQVHMNTVAGNEMLVIDSAKRYQNVNVYGMNPGLVSTNIRANLFGGNSLRFRVMEKIMSLFSPSADDYAKQVAPLLVVSDLEKHSGKSFDSKRQPLIGSSGLADEYVKSYMAASERLVESKSSS